MSYTPEIINSGLDEDRANELFDVYSEWYNGSDYLNSITYNFGFFNQRYSLGGQSTRFQIGNYIVWRQFQDGKYLSVSQSGLELLDEDWELLKQEDVEFSIDGALEIMGDGLVVDYSPGKMSLYDTNNNYTQNESVTEETDFFTKIASFEVPPQLDGISFDPDNERIYYAGTRITTSEAKHYIGAIDLRGSPRNAPQRRYENRLRNDRNYNGGGLEGIWYYDSNLYAYARGRIIRFSAGRGSVTGIDRMTGELPDIDLAGNYLIGPQDVSPDPNGNVHIFFRSAILDGLRKTEKQGPDDFEPPEFNRYFVYDFEEGELVKSMRMYRDFEGIPLIDGTDVKTDSAGFDYPEEIQFTEPEPYAIERDTLQDVRITPWGYVLNIRSSILPRLEFYTHGDELLWRAYDCTFEESELFNHRKRGAPGIRHAYPAYDFVPELWDYDEAKPFPGGQRWCSESTTQPKITAAQGTASWFEGTLIANESIEASASTAVNTTDSNTTAVIDDAVVKAQVGILGGGESIDGGAPAEESNSLFTDSFSVLNSQDVVPKLTSVSFSGTTTSALEFVTVTVNDTVEQPFKATPANSSLVRVNARSRVDTSSVANITESPNLIAIEAEVVSKYPKDPFLKRVMTTGETTGADTVID